MNENNFEEICQKSLKERDDEKFSPFFDFPEMDLRPFKYSKIMDDEQFIEGIEYIVSQIENVCDIIRWLSNESFVSSGVFYESIDPARNAAQRRINKCCNNVQLVKKTLWDYLSSGPIVRNNGTSYTIPLENCIALRNIVNDEADGVELTLNQYQRRTGQISSLPSIEDSCRIYNQMVDSFNSALEAYRRQFNISADVLQDARKANY
jgi:hypothetical protein